MKTALPTFIAITSALAFGATALASEQRVLDTGDRLDIEVNGGLMVHEARAALRDYGYSGFSKGELFGRTIKMTATAPDKKIYRLKINNQTGVLTEVYRVRHIY